MKLYHKDLGFPKNITLNNVTDFPLTWSNHSKNQLNTKYGIDLFPEKNIF